MKKILLIGILVLAAFLRLYSISHVPPSPSLDEVSIGWNAYSILHTGADEYGNRLPILLRAYDDWRPALYVYCTIPFIALLGLTSVAVRLPSVLLSILVVYVTYLIGKLVGKKYFSYEPLGLIASLLVAISPWHIYISRLGHEANIGLALVVCAVYFLLQFVLLHKKPALLASALLFGLSAHGYQSEKIVSPLLILCASYLYRKEFWKERAYALTAVILCFLVALPAIRASISPEGLSRYQGTTAFSADAPAIVDATKQYSKALKNGDIIGRVLHSKYLTYAHVFGENYLSHFSFAWLFTGSIREAHKVPDMGLLYLWELPFLLFGIWALFAKKTPKQVRWLLISWVLVSPLPAAITTQSPHAMRIYTVIPGLQLIEAVGIWWMVSKLGNDWSKAFTSIMTIAVLCGLVVFWNGYFIRFPKEQSDSFQYAMAAAVSYAERHSSSYDSIQFGNQGNLYQSYMFYLFYTAYDPAIYQSHGGTKSGGYNEAHSIGKAVFGFLPERKDQLAPRTLYFYDAGHVPEGIRTIGTFSNLDGKAAIIAGVL